jgi:hypothetical protein
MMTLHAHLDPPTVEAIKNVSEEVQQLSPLHDAEHVQERDARRCSHHFESWGAPVASLSLRRDATCFQNPPIASQRLHQVARHVDAMECPLNDKVT